MLASAAIGMPGSPSAALVAAILSGKIEVVVSRALLEEYEAVLSRPRLVRRHGMSRGAVRRLVNHIASVAAPAQPVVGPVCPDASDQHLWDMLAAVPDSVLVTGDQALIESTDLPGRVISPRRFINEYPDELASR